MPSSLTSSDINSSGRMTSIGAIWSPIKFLVLEKCSDGTGKLYLGKLLLNVNRMCIYDGVCVIFVYTGYVHVMNMPPRSLVYHTWDF